MTQNKHLFRSWPRNRPVSSCVWCYTTLNTKLQHKNTHYATTAPLNAKNEQTEKWIPAKAPHTYSEWLSHTFQNVSVKIKYFDGSLSSMYSCILVTLYFWEIDANKMLYTFMIQVMLLIRAISVTEIMSYSAILDSLIRISPVEETKHNASFVSGHQLLNVITIIL